MDCEKLLAEIDEHASRLSSGAALHLLHCDTCAQQRMVDALIKALVTEGALSTCDSGVLIQTKH